MHEIKESKLNKIGWV